MTAPVNPPDLQAREPRTLRFAVTQAILTIFGRRGRKTRDTSKPTVTGTRCPGTLAMRAIQPHDRISVNVPESGRQALRELKAEQQRADRPAWRRSYPQYDHEDRQKWRALVR